MRRILILAVAMILAATAVNAQDYNRPGQFVVTGATALTVNRQTFSQKDVKDTTSNTSMQVDLGGTYFFSQAIGIGVVVFGQNTSISSTASGSGKTSATSYVAGPHLEMRFGSGKTSFSVFGEAGLGKNTITPDGGDKSETKVRYFGGGGGIQYHFNEMGSFDVMVRYQRSKLTDAEDTKGEFATTASGFIVGVGFSLYFGGK